MKHISQYSLCELALLIAVYPEYLSLGIILMYFFITIISLDVKLTSLP